MWCVYKGASLVHFLGTLTVSLICLTPALAFADTPSEKLQAKAGLWEMRASELRSDSALLPPFSPEDMAEMSEPQRAQVEKLQQSGKTASRTYQSCLTEDSLLAYRPEGLPADCTAVLLKGTTVRQLSQLNCSASKQSGLLKLEAKTPERIVIDLTLFSRDGNRNEGTGTYIEGRWLKADCGN